MLLVSDTILLPLLRNPNYFVPLVWEGHLSLTASLLFWERQLYVGSQTNRILPIAIVFLKHPGLSEMLCELKSPPCMWTLGDVAKWLILILPEDHFCFPSLGKRTNLKREQIWPYEHMPLNILRVLIHNFF